MQPATLIIGAFGVMWRGGVKLLRALVRKLTAPAVRRIPNGYAAAEISDLVAAKTSAAIASDSPETVAPGETLMPLLLALAMWKPSTVLDFGGAAGFHYFAARRVLNLDGMKWAIVEHPHMVARCQEFASNSLGFFASIDEASHWLQTTPDLLHSNGALQYLDHPEQTLSTLLKLEPAAIMWSRCLLGPERREESQTAMLSHYGPGAMPASHSDAEVVSRTIRMCEAEFLAAHEDYSLRWRPAADTFFFQKPS